MARMLICFNFMMSVCLIVVMCKFELIMQVVVFKKSWRDCGLSLKIDLEIGRRCVVAPERCPGYEDTPRTHTHFALLFIMYRGGPSRHLKLRKMKHAHVRVCGGVLCAPQYTLFANFRPRALINE